MSFARRGMSSLIGWVQSQAYNGYTLFSHTEHCTVWLIDMQGRFIHSWDLPNKPATYGILLDSGNLLVNIRQPLSERPIGLSGLAGKLIEYDWDGNVVWEYSDPYMHHDFYRMSNGNTMVVRYVAIPPEVAAKVKGGLGIRPGGTLWSDSFQEVTPEGKVVWEWLPHEHMDPEEYIICPLCPGNEWTHVNSCVVLPNGDILTVFHMNHYIVIIDRGTGKIKWRYGGSEKLGHPHHATILDNGNILIFDNGGHRAPNLKERIFPIISFSRVLEINPANNEIVWEYRDECPFHFYSAIISGAQRLPNGNTLICEGTTGRFFEVTPDKDIVWEYVNPIYDDQQYVIHGLTNAVFRAYRYGPDDPALKGRDLDPHRVELTLKKSPVYDGGDERKAVEERLGGLGY